MITLVDTYTHEINRIKIVCCVSFFHFRSGFVFDVSLSNRRKT